MIVIRNFQPDDMFSVIKIAYESLPERYNPSIFNHFYETFPDGFIVAEKHHKIIGFIVGIKTIENIAKILMLAISKDCRRQGIGSLLINQFLKQVILHNVIHVELEVRTSNISAIDFYKKHGFETIDHIKNFYQNGEDAYIMKKEL